MNGDSRDSGTTGPTTFSQKKCNMLRFHCIFFFEAKIIRVNSQKKKEKFMKKILSKKKESFNES